MCNENEQCSSKNVDDRTVAKPSNGGGSGGGGGGADDKSSVYGIINANKTNPMVSSPKSQRSEKIDMNFDHLSVVSEECLSNSEDQSNKNSSSSNNNNNNSNKMDKNNDKNSNGKPNISRNDTLEGIDESIYTNFQSTVPPLKHFENLSYKDIGPNIGECIHVNSSSN